jgi:hypothetical protein
MTACFVEVLLVLRVVMVIILAKCHVGPVVPWGVIHERGALLAQGARLTLERWLSILVWKVLVERHLV